MKTQFVSKYSQVLGCFTQFPIVWNNISNLTQPQADYIIDIFLQFSGSPKGRHIVDFKPFINVGVFHGISNRYILLISFKKCLIYISLDCVSIFMSSGCRDAFEILPRVIFWLNPGLPITMTPESFDFSLTSVYARQLVSENTFAIDKLGRTP